MTEYAPNTIVVQPKPPPTGGLWFAVLGIGVLIGAVMSRTWMVDPAPRQTVISAPNPVPGTVEIVVRQVWEMPTSTPTEIPTLKATGAPANLVNDCRTDSAPGVPCRIPYPTALPPTPFAVCDLETMQPGIWCRMSGTPEGQA